MLYKDTSAQMDLFPSSFLYSCWLYFTSFFAITTKESCHEKTNLVGSISNWNGHTLLDKVMSHNQWHIGVHQHHLMFKGHWKSSTWDHIWSQKEGVPGQNVSIGSFHASFHNVSICQMTTKANNEVETCLRRNLFEFFFQIFSRH